MEHDEPDGTAAAVAAEAVAAAAEGPPDADGAAVLDLDEFGVPVVPPVSEAELRAALVALPPESDPFFRWVPFDPSTVPLEEGDKGFIGPVLGEWRRRAAAEGDREYWDLFDESPYEDLVDSPLEDVTFRMQCLGANRRDRSRAEAYEIDGLISAWEAVQRAEQQSGQRFTAGGDAERSFLAAAANEEAIEEATVLSWVHLGIDVRDRFPKTWKLFRSGEVPWRNVQMIHAQAEGLDPEHWPAFDDAAEAAILDGQVRKLRVTLHRVRERLQADTAERRRKKAAGRRGARYDELPDGMAALTVVNTADRIRGVFDGIGSAAVLAHGAAGETRGVQQLMADIAVDVLTEGLARPPVTEEPGTDGARATGETSSGARDAFGRLVPQRRGVTATIHITIPALTMLGLSEEPATLDGYGPIDLETAVRYAAGASSWIRVLTDPISGTVLDIDRNPYTPPAALRRWIEVRDGTCRFPGCDRPARKSDLDHIRRHTQNGRTAAVNLMALCRRHHLLKESGRWKGAWADAADVAAWANAWGGMYTSLPAQSPEPVPDAILREHGVDPPIRPPRTDPPVDDLPYPPGRLPKRDRHRVDMSSLLTADEPPPF